MRRGDVPRRVCIIALNAYPAIEPKAGRSIGGLEMRAWNLATGLSQQPDIEVFFMVGHTRPITSTRVGNVTVVPLIDRFRDLRFNVSRSIDALPHFPWFRTRAWHAKLLWQLPLLLATRPFRNRRSMHERISEQLEQLKPDVCMGFGLGEHAAAIVRASERIQRPSIVGLASNADLDAELFSDSRYVNHYGDSSDDCRFVIERASAVLCQTQWQQDRLTELANRESFVIPTPIRAERWSTTETTEPGKYVLWVGRYDEVYKRPQLCLKIARQCPDIPFVMVLNRGDARTERDIRKNATPNVRIVDYVPADEMPDVFRRARLFLSTSQSEGFPNVFLEASASGTPIVTLEDFGNFVSKSECGVWTKGDSDQAVSSVCDLWNDVVSRARYAENGQRSVRQFHSLEAVAENLRNVVDTVRHTPWNDSTSRLDVDPKRKRNTGNEV
ncbi:MAG: glycosyltransferase family 4 protein [Planctomycetes bacterium]|nr:glycosyltransferase family 4 protein [Planctomycetota bacterium]